MIENATTTNENLVQDNSNVTPETTQTNTIQNDGLVFGQKHNDMDCALCPTAKRACDRAWVTARNLEEWSRMSTTTLWRWLGRLEKARRIASFSDMKKTPILDSAGVPHETTFYNLNVLNQLAMAYPDREQWHMNAYGVRLFPKWACDILDKVYDEDDTFLIEYRTV